MNFTSGSRILTDTASTGTFFLLDHAATSRNGSALRLYAEGNRQRMNGGVNGPGRRRRAHRWRYGRAG